MPCGIAEPSEHNWFVRLLRKLATRRSGRAGQAPPLQEELRIGQKDGDAGRTNVGLDSEGKVQRHLQEAWAAQRVLDQAQL
jgi:hypothetical protein